MNSNKLIDKAQQHQSKGYSFFNSGNLDGALEHLNQALELFNTLDDKRGMNTQLTMIGWIKRTQGKLDQALEIFFRQLELSKEINDNKRISLTLQAIAFIYFYKGDLGLAEKYSNEGLEFSKEINYKSGVFGIYSILGSISRVKGDYEVSLDYYLKSLGIYNEKLANQKRVPHNYCYAYRCMGLIYWVQNKIDKAVECFKKAIESHKTICTFRNSLFDYEVLSLHIFLIETSYILNDEKQVIDSLEELSLIAERWPWAKLFWKLGQANYLAKKKRMKHKIQAQQLYEEILKVPFDYEMEFNVRFNLCDLLVEELKYSGTEEILIEVQDHLKKISEVATKLRSLYSLINLYYLQAKLSLIEGNAEFANELLTKAITLAKSKGLELFVIMLENLQDELFNQLGEWKVFLTRNSRLQEKVEILSLKNDLTEAITDVLEKKFKTELDPLNLEDEEPTLLLILTKGGVQLFSYSFTDELKLDDDILANFLSAFDSFSDEAFSKGLDRAKFGDYIVVMEPIESFSVCYLFKGQPYVARQKLIKFINGIQKNASIMQKLDKFSQTSQVIKVNDSPDLESLIGEIFIIQ